MTANASDRECFEAAVKIIQSLPKDGPFQPSNDMKLKFYGLFKQATIGPCVDKQPGFWDVIARAKWSSWKTLGGMSKEEAMRGYVDALKQVVETMTLDANVQDFLDKVGPMYEFVTDDGEVITKRADWLIRNDFIQPPIPVDVSAKQNQMNGKSEKPRKDENNHDEANDRIRTNGIDYHHKEYNHAAGVNNGDMDGCSDEDIFDDAADNNVDLVIPLVTLSGSVPLTQSLRDTVSVSPSPLSSVESKTAYSDDELHNVVLKSVECNSLTDANRLAAHRHDAVNAVGQLLRDMTELESIKGDDVSDSMVKTWSLVNRIRAKQARRNRADDEWMLEQLARLRQNKSKRKNRGRNDDQCTSRDQGNVGTSDASGQELSTLNAGNALANRSTASNRSRRQISGDSSGSDSSGGSSSLLDFDPHVGAVLLRMHRELQYINRQLELMEGILITQQQLIKSVIAHSNKETKQRRWFLSNLSWRSLLFILTWPVIVHFGATFFRMLMLRTKRRLR